VNYRERKDFHGFIHKEWRNEFGELHRESGPAQIYCNSDDSIVWEIFCVNGLLHRENGPAQICYYPDGSIEYEEFYSAGKYLGRNKRGFWKLWETLTEVERNNPSILKYLARYS